MRRGPRSSSRLLRPMRRRVGGWWRNARASAFSQMRSSSWSKFQRSTNGCAVAAIHNDFMTSLVDPMVHGIEAVPGLVTSPVYQAKPFMQGYRAPKEDELSAWTGYDAASVAESEVA